MTARRAAAADVPLARARPALPVRRAVSAGEAAIYLGISESKFRMLVDDGRMPKPRMLDARRLWDIDELDTAFRMLPREGEEEVDTWADVRGR